MKWSHSATDNDKLTYFRRLARMDAVLCDVTCHYLDLIYKSIQDTCGYPDDYQIVGSAAEGTVLARNFYPSEDGPLHDSIELEHDVELVVVDFRNPAVEESNRGLLSVSAFESIPEKPGYVRLSGRDEEAKRLYTRLLSHLDATAFDTSASFRYGDLLDSNGYISSLQARYMLKRLSTEDFTISRVRDLLRALSLGGEFSIADPRSERAITKASYAQRYEVSYRHRRVLDATYDTAVTVRASTNLIPNKEALYAWSSRESFVNSMSENEAEEMGSLIRHTFIIAKPSDGVLPDQESNEWRVSFAHVEKALTKWWCKQQMTVYFMFKSIFYRHIKPINPDCLPSYLCKTVMLWVSEKYPRAHPLWNDSADATWRALTYLINFLCDALKSNRLPYFFVTEINVLKNVDESTRLKAIALIEKIALNVTAFLPDDVACLCENLSKLPLSLASLLSTCVRKRFGLDLMSAAPVRLASFAHALKLYLRGTLGEEHPLERYLSGTADVILKLDELDDVADLAEPVELD